MGCRRGSNWDGLDDSERSPRTPILYQRTSVPTHLFSKASRRVYPSGITLAVRDVRFRRLSVMEAPFRQYTQRLVAIMVLIPDAAGAICRPVPTERQQPDARSLSPRLLVCL